MKNSLWFSLWLLPTICSAQMDHAVITGQIKYLSEATRDPQCDSLGDAIKANLRILLEQDDAMTADFSDIPISRVDAPDGKFRLFTFNVPYANGTQRFEGILLVQEKSRRVVYELQDKTDKIITPLSKKLTPENWYGAVYYAVVPPQSKKSTYYTLLGWKGYSNVESRKVIEILSFNGPIPSFGAQVFSEGKLKHFRKVFGFGFQSSMSLKWDDANKGIVFDHLAPAKPEFEGKAAFMGPDLSFDAYVPYKGKWSYLRDVDARNMQLTKPSKRPQTEQR
ncbi:MAG: hypothetical protein IPO90_03560 [Flavobacteriales bacterium]|nr:hypothetical protein [Flavobacteriales bacterium]